MKSQVTHTSDAQTMASLSRWVLLAFLVLTSGLTFWYGQFRPIDGDEGFYAAAASLVNQGKTPYEDFFYPQGSLLPYVYSVFVKLGGHHLKALRLGSSLLTVLALIPWLWWLLTHSAWRLPVAVTAGLLLVLDPHLLSWNVTVKTFAFTNLCISWALFFLFRGWITRHWLWFAGAGLCAGLAVSTRTMYGPMVGSWAFFLFILAGVKKDRQWALLAGAFLSGLLIGSLPLIISWIRDPEAFVFNNYTCHQVRFSLLRSQGLGSSLWPRMAAAGDALAQVFLAKPYRLLILLLAGLGWWRVLRTGPPGTIQGRSFYGLSLMGAFVFSITALLPDPIQEQYFTATTGPLLIPAVAWGLVWFSERWPRVPVPGVLVLAVPFSYFALAIQQDGINQDHEWTWDSYEQVCSLIEKHTEPDAMVASFWPGYVFETGRRHLPGMENHFAVGVSEAISAADARRFHIINKDLLAEYFRARRPNAVVLGVWMNELNTVLDDDQMRELLGVFQDHYCFEDNIGRAKITLPCARGEVGSLNP